MNNVMVSVVMAVYNGEKYVREAVGQSGYRNGIVPVDGVRFWICNMD